MPYVPDATDIANPPDAGVKASSAAAEFRTLKLYIRDIILGTLNTKAPYNTPVFTGVATFNGRAAFNAAVGFAESPTAPTPPATDASDKVATMAAIAAATFSSVLPGASTGKYSGITSDGVTIKWGVSSADAMAIINFLGNQ